MDIIDRIRARFERQRSNQKVLTGDEAWALLDLADAFRDRERTPSYTVNCDCADCAMYRAEIMDAHKRMSDALARLNGDAEGE